VIVRVLRAVMVEIVKTTLKDKLVKLVKIGAKVNPYAKYVMVQLAEVAVPRPLFVSILARISRFETVPALCLSRY